MPSDLTAGIEFNQDKLEDNMWGYHRTVDQKVNIGSAFLQNEWKNDHWGFLLGGRLDKHNLIDHIIFSPRANLRFNPTQNINLRLSYSSGFRAPQAFDEDLHVENVGGNVAMVELAKDLKEERSQSLSASADIYHRFGAFQINFLVEGFYTKLSDVFALTDGEVKDGILTRTRYNAPGARVMGLTLEGKMAYLNKFQIQADVNFKVVKQFIKSVEERAIGQDVMQSLTPGQMVIKIVNEEMVSLMGSETTEIALKSGNEITVIMMAGLQGAGKTTTTAKLAGKFKSKGRKPLLVACDIYRPAAIEQLRINGEKQGVEVFSMGTNNNPVDIAKAAIQHAKNNNFNVVILDTAGRLHVDEDMMAELQHIKQEIAVDQTILVVDSMTGQDAVNVAATFNEKIGIDGVILTKLDGDTRGGAALSIKAVTGKPILYVGMGEKLSDLEQFYPDRMASRILGMGDVLTLIEKAEAQIDEEQAKKMGEKLKKAEFDFNDFLDYMGQIKNMGGIGSILNMLPGMGLGGQMKNMTVPDDAEDNLRRTEAIIYSMTAKERANPDILNPSRKNRIAKGAGVDISEVNRLVKQFDQMKKMMKQMPGMMKGANKGRFRLPF